MGSINFEDWVDQEDRKNVRKWYRGLRRNMAKKHGLLLYKSTYLIQENRDIDLIGSICFDYTPSQLIVETAIQPLYERSECIHFTCGARINEYPPSVGHSLCGYKSMLDEDMRLIEDRLENQTLPLFDSMKTTEDFVWLLENISKTPFRCRDNFLYTYIAYGYLKMEDYRKAEQKLVFLLEYIKQAGYTCDMSEPQELLRCVQDHNYDRVQQILSENVAYTKAHCQLS